MPKGLDRDDPDSSPRGGKYGDRTRFGCGGVDSSPRGGKYALMEPDPYGPHDSSPRGGKYVTLPTGFDPGLRFIPAWGEVRTSPGRTLAAADRFIPAWGKYVEGETDLFAGVKEPERR